MNAKAEGFLKNTKGKSAGLFIDNANWFYPQKELGWRISFSKLRSFLEKYYEIKISNIYAGTPIDNKDGKSFDCFKLAAERANFKIITKPLKKIWLNRSKGEFVYKCNFDVEISFDIARHISKLDVVIIGSGDSDFLEAKNYVLESGKKFLVMCFERGVAWEMRKLYHLFLEELRSDVQH